MFPTLTTLSPSQNELPIEDRPQFKVFLSAVGRDPKFSRLPKAVKKKEATRRYFDWLANPPSQRNRTRRPDTVQAPRRRALPPQPRQKTPASSGLSLSSVQAANAALPHNTPFLPGYGPERKAIVVEGVGLQTFQLTPSSGQTQDLVILFDPCTPGGAWVCQTTASSDPNLYECMPVENGTQYACNPTGLYQTNDGLHVNNGFAPLQFIRDPFAGLEATNDAIAKSAGNVESNEMYRILPVNQTTFVQVGQGSADFEVQCAWGAQATVFTTGSGTCPPYFGPSVGYTKHEGSGDEANIQSFNYVAGYEQNMGLNNQINPLGFHTPIFDLMTQSLPPTVLVGGGNHASEAFSMALSSPMEGTWQRMGSTSYCETVQASLSNPTWPNNWFVNNVPKGAVTADPFGPTPGSGLYTPPFVWRDTPLQRSFNSDIPAFNDISMQPPPYPSNSNENDYGLFWEQLKRTYGNCGSGINGNLSGMMLVRATGAPVTITLRRTQSWSVQPTSQSPIQMLSVPCIPSKPLSAAVTGQTASGSTRQIARAKRAALQAAAASRDGFSPAVIKVFEAAATGRVLEETSAASGVVARIVDSGKRSVNVASAMYSDLPAPIRALLGMAASAAIKGMVTKLAGMSGYSRMHAMERMAPAMRADQLLLTPNNRGYTWEHASRRDYPGWGDLGNEVADGIADID